MVEYLLSKIPIDHKKISIKKRVANDSKDSYKNFQLYDVPFDFDRVK